MSTSVTTATSAASSVASSSHVSAAASSASSQAAASSSSSQTVSSPAASGSTSGAASSTASSAASSAAASASTSGMTSASESSSIASSVSASKSSSISSASNATASASAVASGSKGLSGGAIGGISGGAAGGVILLVLIWFLWRRRRDKKDWVPPPPPGEMAYKPRRQRGSTTLDAPVINRASSYSTLLQPRTPSYPNSSYYASYPIATPSTMSHDNPLPTNSGTASNESSPPLSGLNTPAVKPVLAPIVTNLERDSSGSSDGRPPPRHQSSVDRLRQVAMNDAPSRQASISSGHERNPSEGGSSRAASPHPSMNGMPSPHRPRHPSVSSSLNPGYPRPASSYSLSSNTGSHRIGGAPHQRHVQVEMPKLLGARPDSNGDFFSSLPRSHESMHWSTVDGHRSSRQDLQDFAPPVTGHTRRPSNLSMSAVPPSRDRQRHTFSNV